MVSGIVIDAHSGPKDRRRDGHKDGHEHGHRDSHTDAHSGPQKMVTKMVTGPTPQHCIVVLLFIVVHFL